MAAARGRRIHVRFERSWDVSYDRGCRDGDMIVVAPDYAGGEVAVMVSAEGQVVPEFLPQNWLRGTRALRQGALEHILHRGLDVFASLTLLLLTLPLMLMVALAIKLDSRGPVFYRQERIGRHHRTFQILKFRSMTVDAEKPGAAVWAAVGDSRVTRVGRFIRLTRIDEIPQAINILRGDMAFVGPRPERPVFVEQLIAAIPHYADRAAVRPGLTGWAQVKCPYGASIEDARDKLSYDLWYIRQRSLWLDLRIILATVRVVLRQAGAR
jgi:exopolysaccharide biosynthesis polyprenyl glycosylphosphotransferase